MEWILENIHTLRRGEWPDSIPSGYTALPGGHSQRAPFENPCLLAAEVSIRISRCGMDGYLVEEKYYNGLSEDEIARKRHLPINRIIRTINKVVWYVSSGRVPRWKDTRWRKGQTYEEWKHNKLYRRKECLS